MKPMVRARSMGMRLTRDTPGRRLGFMAVSPSRPYSEKTGPRARQKCETKVWVIAAGAGGEPEVALSRGERDTTTEGSHPSSLTSSQPFHDQPVRTRPLRPLHLVRGRHSRAPGLLSRQGARELRSRGRHPHPHRHRPDQRLRPQPRGDPAEGAGADPDRALLVRGDARALSQPRHRVSRSQRAGRASAWR